MRIAFYELEAWEREHLARSAAFEEGWEFSSEPLPADAASPEIEALSVFIYSHVTAETLARFPRLRLVTTRSTGYDHIDLAACRERGVTVCNVPRYGENTVAEHTFGLILALSRKIHQAYQRTSRFDFSIEGLRGFDLKGKRLGVVGGGAIGLHVVRIARGFGMHVVVSDPRAQPLLAEVLGFEYVPLLDLLRIADVISLHAPLRPETHHLIDRARFREIKRGALLVNTARGGLVDTAALVEALDEGILSGAALDVFEGEEVIREEAQLLQGGIAPENVVTLLRNYNLLRRENVVITPHIAFYSQEAQQRILDTTLENIQSFLAGTPANVVAG
jgi:D-lactate dehydrogenase